MLRLLCPPPPLWVVSCLCPLPGALPGRAGSGDWPSPASCGWGRPRRDSASGPSPVSAVEAFEEVADSLCVSQHSRDGEERVVLFLKMASGRSFQPDLVRRLRDAIREGLSARHVPSLILETKDIPVRPPAGSVSCRLAAGTGAPPPPTSPARRACPLDARASYGVCPRRLATAPPFSCHLSF